MEADNFVSGPYFGDFGGRFVAESLMGPLEEVEVAWKRLWRDRSFQRRLRDLLANYAGRPSLLTEAPRFASDLGGVRVFLKREDLNHTGSHKINNVLGQALLTKEIGKTRVIAETGAGQHGVATATAAALLGLECTIYMGREDTERQALNVARMQMLGAEGIAVGLSSKILPHNFNELIDASVACLRGEEFTLYPDFQTGGLVDVAKYNDGNRGGMVKVRARITKVDNRTLAITEIPYGYTTGTLIDSIIKANEKGKIKIRKVDDNTAREVEILIHLAPGVSSDKTIDALYAFTDCEKSVYMNCCVIEDNKPRFMSVSEVLRHSTEQTLGLLRTELEIERGELREELFYASLERIFIEERIYKDKEFEQAPDMDAAVAHIDRRLEPFKPRLIREVTREDILKLMEIKMGRILKFNADRNDEQIARLKGEIERVEHHLSHLTDYAVAWFEGLKKKYGSDKPRRTEIRSFDRVEATKVAEANEKLYIDREEGFVGTGLKKAEFVCNCSDIDDIILFYRSGVYKVMRVSEKIFVGQDVIYVNVFNRNDTRTIYNVIYRDGRAGCNYIKRFAVTGSTRDKEYNVTRGTEGSRILYFSANPNGEAETVKVILKPKLRQKTLVFEKDFSEILIKGRTSLGNILTRAEIHKILLKQRGSSTLGGRESQERQGEEGNEYVSSDVPLG